jgi:hypothetical protein
VISTLHKPKRVISILSAPTSNEISDDNESFLEYQHPITMTEIELCAVFGDRYTASKAEEFAGGHPYYVRLYLELGEVQFLDKVHDDVFQSTTRLQEANPLQWPLVLDAIILCLLGCCRSYIFPYDKKLLVPKRSSSINTVHFVPILPSALTMYRRLYWNQVMENVALREALYLQACANRETTNDTCGRIFEAIAVQRIKSRGLKIKGSWGGVLEHEVEVISGNLEWFSGSELPEFAAIAEKILYVPDSCSFPAIDFFVRTGSTLVAFQVRVSKHDAGCNTLLAMCSDAGWFKGHATIVLI